MVQYFELGDENNVTSVFQNIVRHILHEKRPPQKIRDCSRISKVVDPVLGQAKTVQQKHAVMDALQIVNTKQIELISSSGPYTPTQRTGTMKTAKKVVSNFESVGLTPDREEFTAMVLNTRTLLHRPTCSMNIQITTI
eukprot:TRINITY_DN8497_c0_g1_i1.p1 TRINITY_DN8497_c0_g1~~TRINITY_DN8497_c0_g1_i1.p1  ORF type:complete len:138 (+),score=3.47 TRINITY_DN8497_c0_g1_i1:137-550(+)